MLKIVHDVTFMGDKNRPKIVVSFYMLKMEFFQSKHVNTVD